jgi:hypothetical protein
MLSCREATRLMSESRERELAASERLSLAMHKAICAACRNFERQLPVLGELMRRFAAGAGEPPPGAEEKKEKE